MQIVQQKHYLVEAVIRNEQSSLSRYRFHQNFISLEPASARSLWPESMLDTFVADNALALVCFDRTSRIKIFAFQKSVDKQGSP